MIKMRRLRCDCLLLVAALLAALLTATADARLPANNSILGIRSASRERVLQNQGNSTNSSTQQQQFVISLVSITGAAVSNATATAIQIAIAMKQALQAYNCTPTRTILLKTNLTDSSGRISGEGTNVAELQSNKTRLNIYTGFQANSIAALETMASALANQAVKRTIAQKLVNSKIIPSPEDFVIDQIVVSDVATGLKIIPTSSPSSTSPGEIPTRQNETAPTKSERVLGLTNVQFILVVVGATVGLLIIAGAAIYYRRRKLIAGQLKGNDQENLPDILTPPRSSTVDFFSRHKGSSRDLSIDKVMAAGQRNSSRRSVGEKEFIF